MFRRIRDFLYRVTHASGQLFYLTANLGPFDARLWVGREDPDAVAFALDIDLDYGPIFGPQLSARVEVGVIEVQLDLTKNSSE
ncbi:hypothetical protein LCGC14_2474520 [marine sediment metagenome]|uniref:Uncharacterized protein n=1 Tax=marine sediment metagenome TaxID=412755 RepID=A0A0F9DLH5_9ZZZZ